MILLLCSERPCLFSPLRPGFFPLSPVLFRPLSFLGGFFFPLVVVGSHTQFREAQGLFGPPTFFYRGGVSHVCLPPPKTDFVSPPGGFSPPFLGAVKISPQPLCALYNIVGLTKSSAGRLIPPQIFRLVPPLTFGGEKSPPLGGTIRKVPPSRGYLRRKRCGSQTFPPWDVFPPFPL